MRYFIRPESIVKKDIKILQNCPFLREELSRNVKGYVFDLKMNRLTEVS
jgi:hypothetical protein